jgi:diacylglycerol kinase (ATP)
MSEAPLIIVNPASAAGSTSNAWPRIASDLAAYFGPFRCAFTEKQGDARLIAREAAAAGDRFIVACGGDGTISEVANGILDSGRDSELGVLPSGTGGDFRRSLDIPSRSADAAAVLRTGCTRRMDVGQITYVNHSEQSETRYFLGVASFGMSGEVVKRVKRDRAAWRAALPANWLGGKATFASAMLRTAISFPNRELVVEVDELSPRKLMVVNLCVANARYFGGGMKIAPDAQVDDGRFDVVCLGDLSSLDILVNAPLLYTGRHLNLQKVKHEHARSVAVSSADPSEVILVEVDGELPGRLPARCKIIPKALRVRCPTAT